MKDLEPSSTSSNNSEPVPISLDDWQATPVALDAWEVGTSSAETAENPESSPKPDTLTPQPVEAKTPEPQPISLDDWSVQAVSLDAWEVETPEISTTTESSKTDPQTERHTSENSESSIETADPKSPKVENETKLDLDDSGSDIADSELEGPIDFSENIFEDAQAQKASENITPTRTVKFDANSEAAEIDDGEDQIPSHEPSLLTDNEDLGLDIDDLSLPGTETETIPPEAVHAAEPQEVEFKEEDLFDPPTVATISSSIDFDLEEEPQDNMDAETKMAQPEEGTSESVDSEQEDFSIDIEEEEAGAETPNMDIEITGTADEVTVDSDDDILTSEDDTSDLGIEINHDVEIELGAEPELQKEPEVNASTEQPSEDNSTIDASAVIANSSSVAEPESNTTEPLESSKTKIIDLQNEDLVSAHAIQLSEQDLASEQVLRLSQMDLATEHRQPVLRLSEVDLYENSTLPVIKLNEIDLASHHRIVFELPITFFEEKDIDRNERGVILLKAEDLVDPSVLEEDELDDKPKRSERKRKTRTPKESKWDDQRIIKVCLYSIAFFMVAIPINFHFKYAWVTVDETRYAEIQENTSGFDWYFKTMFKYRTEDSSWRWYGRQKLNSSAYEEASSESGMAWLKYEDSGSPNIGDDLN
jgi:hypothetical protein